MNVEKFNSEGYYDPTAYEALCAIEKEERALRAFRPIVFICSPYAGEVEENIRAARRYSRFAVDRSEGTRLNSVTRESGSRMPSSA